MAGTKVGRRGAGPPGRTAEPALLGPVSRPGGETTLIIAAAVAFQILVWYFLIWLLRAGGPWYHFFDVSDIGVYLEYAQKVSASGGYSKEKSL
jgi:hypothetical protein